MAKNKGVRKTTKSKPSNHGRLYRRKQKDKDDEEVQVVQVRIHFRCLDSNSYRLLTIFSELRYLKMQFFLYFRSKTLKMRRMMLMMLQMMVMISKIKRQGNLSHSKIGRRRNLEDSNPWVCNFTTRRNKAKILHILTSTHCSSDTVNFIHFISIITFSFVLKPLSIIV